MLETFYATVAQVSFTLLGLWWVVVQFKFDAWATDPARRRMSRHVSMYFLVPAVMSLFALLATRVSAVWRIGFGVSAVLGLVEALFSLRETRPSDRRGALRWAATALGALLYLVVAIVAAAPELATSLPGELRPIEVEGMLLAILLFIGASFAWSMFVERGASGQGRPAAVAALPERRDAVGHPSE